MCCNGDVNVLQWCCKCAAINDCMYSNTIAAHIQQHCSTFTAPLLNTKFRLIWEEENSELLNWCYLFEGLIENGKVKKELNKTWQTILIILSKLYISNTDKTFWCCNMQHNFSTFYFIIIIITQKPGTRVWIPKGKSKPKMESQEWDLTTPTPSPPGGYKYLG